MAAEQAKHAFRPKLQQLEALFRQTHTQSVLCALSLVTERVCQYLVAHCHLQPPALEQPSETPKTSCTQYVIYFRKMSTNIRRDDSRNNWAGSKRPPGNGNWSCHARCVHVICLCIYYRPNPTHTLTHVFVCMCTFAPTHRSLTCTLDTHCPSCLPFESVCHVW